MALTEQTKQQLDEALAACGAEGYTIFGAIVNSDASELQAFGNGSDNPQAWVHNMETSAAAVQETINNKNEA